MRTTKSAMSQTSPARGRTPARRPSFITALSIVRVGVSEFPRLRPRDSSLQFRPVLVSVNRYLSTDSFTQFRLTVFFRHGNSIWGGADVVYYYVHAIRQCNSCPCRPCSPSLFNNLSKCVEMRESQPYPPGAASLNNLSQAVVCPALRHLYLLISTLMPKKSLSSNDNPTTRVRRSKIVVFSISPYSTRGSSIRLPIALDAPVAPPYPGPADAAQARAAGAHMADAAQARTECDWIVPCSKGDGWVGTILFHLDRRREDPRALPPESAHVAVL
jgi:hypothetical protein